MASKIFCCCCQAGEASSTTVVSRSPRISQQYPPRSFNLNADSRKNGFQKRCAQHPANNRMLKACTLGRP
uniref:Testis expressed 53 n=1 Tax=Ailuropoda melanoleuca TaxID=9646 RepID=A0A7N5JCT6_AILME